jgi:hypothetical protein
VTAEELAPFLDAPSGDLRQDGTTVDEGFVVPALVRFNGSPEVDASGNLLYRFPSLQRTRQSKVCCNHGYLVYGNFWKLQELKESAGVIRTIIIIIIIIIVTRFGCSVHHRNSATQRDKGLSNA